LRRFSNCAFNGWHQVGDSDTNYSIVAVGDYFGNGTSDILFRNNSTGDTWFEAMSNGAFSGYQRRASWVERLAHEVPYGRTRLARK
jgi:hypothetical protein